METLGIELPKLILQAVNFLLLAAILTKLVYKPLLSALEKRQQLIKDNLDKENSLIQVEAELDDKSKAVLAEAKKQAEALIKEAKKTSLVEKQELLALGKKELEQERLKLHKEMEGILSDKEQQLRQKTADLIEGVLARILEKALTPDQQHEIIKASVKQIGNLHD